MGSPVGQTHHQGARPAAETRRPRFRRFERGENRSGTLSPFPADRPFPPRHLIVATRFPHQAPVPVPPPANQQPPRIRYLIRCRLPEILLRPTGWADRKPPIGRQCWGTAHCRENSRGWERHRALCLHCLSSWSLFPLPHGPSPRCEANTSTPHRQRLPIGRRRPEQPGSVEPPAPPLVAAIV